MSAMFMNRSGKTLFGEYEPPTSTAPDRKPTQAKSDPLSLDSENASQHGTEKKSTNAPDDDKKE
jgi:hypothetical protein